MRLVLVMGSEASPCVSTKLKSLIQENAQLALAARF